MIYFAAIACFVALISIGVDYSARKGYIKRLGSKQAVIDILRHELKRVAGELQAEREETYRLRAEVKNKNNAILDIRVEIERLTPKRNARGKFVGRSEEL